MTIYDIYLFGAVGAMIVFALVLALVTWSTRGQ